MRSKLAIWSLISVISIFILSYSLGLVIYIFLIPIIIKGLLFILYLIPLGLGISALVVIKKDKNLKGKGLAITGIVLSSIFFIIGLISLIFFIIVKTFQP